MIVAHGKNQINRLPAQSKLNIVLQAMQRNQTITEIAKQNNCSRTTVYQQQTKAINAANNALFK